MQEVSPVVTARDGAVVEIVLNRPDRLNAIEHSLVAGVRAALSSARADDVRAVIIRGEGRAFCAGGDLVRFGELVESGAGVDQQLPDELHAMVEDLRTLPKPVIALVHGACAGAGMSLALACDLVIAADDAFFNLAYSGIGLSPDGSSTYFLPRHVGLKKATELFFAPRKLGATAVLELGLINQIVPAADLLQAGRAYARGLAAGPTRAFAAVKALLLQTFTNDLPTQLALETRYVVETSATEDFADGVRAFLAKRPPAFHGR
ncbi:MAG TPA: enoyl-CoA hydratase-related protein [Kofleriaceae bacterium]|nr:enoyl-CoA hydratase-related protein [Kofleriaceae bacterium]